MGDIETSQIDNGLAVVLGRLCKVAGVPVDPVRAAQVARNAAREIPPTAARAARLRTVRAGESVGLQLRTKHLSVREALTFVSLGTPLAVFAVTPAGSANWFLLSDGRLEPLDRDGSPVRERADAIARRLGAADADDVLEWFLPEPATHLEDAATPVAAGHGHGHDDHPGGHMPPLRRLRGLLRPDNRDLWIVLLYAVAVGILGLAVPITAMAVVNTVALATLTQQLLVLCVALLVALTLAAGLQLLQQFVVEYIQRRVFVRVAADLSHRLPRVQLKAFDRQHGPELVNRFFDVLTVQKAAATILLDGVALALQMVIGLVLLATYDSTGALLGFDLVLIGAIALLIWVFGRGGVRTAIDESLAKYAVAGWMEEVARHPIAFKLSGGPLFARERTDLLCRRYLEARSAHFRVLLRQIGFGLFLQVMATVALLAIGGYMVIAGRLTLGQLVAAQLVVNMVVATFGKLGKQLESYYDLMAGTDKLGHLLDLPLEKEGGVPHPERSGGAKVSVRNVTFTHEGMHHPAVRELSFDLEPGERVALAGPNGSGKTTLVDLLFGLRTPDSGWIEIDGVDVRDLRPESLRSHVALVEKIEIFEGTVAANVRMGREDLTLADIRGSLAAVGLLDDILALPDGLDTVLGVGGAPLSLGMTERLMLARAIAGQPRLLVLDETLDNMDRALRDEVLPGLFGPDANWTLLVVTHSPEVEALCGRSLALEKTKHAPHGHEPSAHS